MKANPTAAKTAILNPMTKNSDTEAIREFLVNRGVQAFQVQAGYLPGVTGVALPITEAQFSIETRSQRKTRHIRTMQWINKILPRGSHYFTFEELPQITFVTYEEWRKVENE